MVFGSKLALSVSRSDGARAWMRWMLIAVTLKCRKCWSYKGNSFAYQWAVHFQSEAPRLFRGPESQSQAPRLLEEILHFPESFLTLKLFQLRAPGKCEKKCGSIWYRKLRCFLKRRQFRVDFQLSVRSSTLCKDFHSKTRCFIKFLHVWMKSYMKYCRILSV